MLKKNKNLVFKSYDFLIECYAKIPFNNLDSKDEDFKFLFEYKDYLDNLGSKLSNLFKNKDNSTIIAKDILEDLKPMFNKNYRRDILRKYNIDKSK